MWFFKPVGKVQNAWVGILRPAKDAILEKTDVLSFAPIWIQNTNYVYYNPENHNLNHFWETGPIICGQTSPKFIPATVPSFLKKKNVMLKRTILILCEKIVGWDLG